ncbi:MAG: phosphonopyruvate decarboxylase [Muribaculaceae bacterium]|nr:phosphonopyruvate decarboxylase [Muribaculaceae bacterium]
MTDLNTLFSELKKNGIDFFTGVPDSLLNDFCTYLSDNFPASKHIMAANEGNAVGIAAGYHMATGRLPVVYMQNSGIGNAMNPLLSLTHRDVYSIPMILVIGWRGAPDIEDHCQHRKQGELTPVLMADMDIPCQVLDSEDSVVEKFMWAQHTAREIGSPVALIVKKGILSRKDKKQSYPESQLLSREEAIGTVLDTLGDRGVYLATTGRATRELHEQLKLHGLAAGHEFLNVGAMGHLSSIALGMATGCPDRKIVVFDGDASAVMHLGSLATNGRYMPGNLIHIVLNNGVNESVGGQESPGQTADLTQIAAACGYETAGGAIKDREGLQRIIQGFHNQDRPCFIDMHVRQGIRPDMPKLSIDHLRVKSDLMDQFKYNK